ncbi:argininosuccinate synthase [Candidatus Carsonella ruddii]|uniref:Argininosuccinate synthase n=1 Tax=Carsonella ruddii TaxID=114186 RepID=A0AAJ6JST0_CARRU|nr:argininosuccinate synthase [Candidatus Carsonella ruddii]WGS66596.1 argininosuccinate synthase [Candidatus Carsonella ruddii]WGS66794.1 argininosuccinate synthase [Candidatus Carsonella ruddii]WGS66985.1 argininosuccinate synthase [Candidatus Carsonella ruddii]WGS67176.1 argininosuccinate synthase [Candidatus Carsonella ruddii]WMC18193.1 MAG: argininosuccinate synthase [Candidatus Carsonella ruddii]
MLKKKIVLAYSGGLDTSVIIKWLQEKNFEVITFTADIGQGDEINFAKNKAKKLNVTRIYIKNLKNEFIKNYIFPYLRSSSEYENSYLLGTALARPLIVKELMKISFYEKTNFVSHGATGKGNDQIRFELGFKYFNPNINIIAPWRIWEINTRDKLLNFCLKNNIKINKKTKKFSIDKNLFHNSYEGGDLENLFFEPNEDMWENTVSNQISIDYPIYLSLTFKNGDLIKINNNNYNNETLFLKLNKIGSISGIGRIDIIENRFIGIKSRGCYESPGATIIMFARKHLEDLVLDKEIFYFKKSISLKYSSLIYNGFWWSPERILLQNIIDYTQKYVNGVIKLKIYKGVINVVSRYSFNSLYSQKNSSFNEISEKFSQLDSSGFININSLRLII